METLKIEWVKTKFENIQKHKDVVFFVFTTNSKILHIGVIFSKPIHEAIDDAIWKYGFDTSKIKLYVGYINLSQTSYQQITESLVFDAKKILVSANPTVFNENQGNCYRGRRNVGILSNGCNLIRTKSQCDKGGIVSSSNSKHKIIPIKYTKMLLL